MQSPCALMKTTDVAGCSVEFQTLKEPRAIIARTFKTPGRPLGAVVFSLIGFRRIIFQSPKP